MHMSGDHLMDHAVPGACDVILDLICDCLRAHRGVLLTIIRIARFLIFEKIGICCTQSENGGAQEREGLDTERFSDHFYRGLGCAVHPAIGVRLISGYGRDEENHPILPLQHLRDKSPEASKNSHSIDVDDFLPLVRIPFVQSFFDPLTGTEYGIVRYSMTFNQPLI